jgi:VIT1/CCC1 family predicted Fe2+/Mn2+ transporter
VSKPKLVSASSISTHTSQSREHHLENTTALAKIGILDQVSLAAKPQNRLASFMGGILGGFIPIASFVLAHIECPIYPIMWILVAAGMAYSAITVYEWASIAFKYWAKAFGFVVLVEGVAIFAHTPQIFYAALTILVAINAIATAYTLVSDREEKREILKVSVPSEAIESFY